MENIIDRINKLLALSQSPNQAEAAAAAAKASELLTRHNLSYADLGGKQEDVTHEDFEFMNRVPQWKAILIYAVAKANYCEGTYTPGCGLRLYGSPTNILVAKQLYKYLTDATDRLAQKFGAGRGRLYLNSFRMGCASELAGRLKESHEAKMRDGVAGDADSNAVSAIVCRSMDEKAMESIRRYKSDQGIRTSVSTATCRGNGVSDGRSAAQPISLAPQVGGNSQRALTGGR